MAEEQNKIISEQECGGNDEVEAKDRGLFDHFGKKKEDEVLVCGVENVHIEEEVKEKKEYEEEKKEGLLHKLHRSSSSSSSSSDEEEEVEVDGVLVKQKKKKGLKEKIKEKLGHGHGHDHNKEEDIEEKEQQVLIEQQVDVVSSDSYGDTHEVKVEKVEEKLQVETTQEEEKKGFLDKLKEKLPGHKKATDDAVAEPPVVVESYEGEGKEKKGFIGKIMEKLPGYHKEEKECNDKPSH